MSTLRLQLKVESRSFPLVCIQGAVLLTVVHSPGKYDIGQKLGTETRESSLTEKED